MQEIWVGKIPQKGKGYPRQYSGLENSKGCIFHGVTKSHIRLSNFHFPENKWKVAFGGRDGKNAEYIMRNTGLESRLPEEISGPCYLFPVWESSENVKKLVGQLGLEGEVWIRDTNIGNNYKWKLKPWDNPGLEDKGGTYTFWSL